MTSKLKTYALCPVSEKKVNERVARVNAAFTVLLVILFLGTQNILFIVFLALDFLFRATTYARFSLVAISSRNIVRYLPVKELMINAGPKIFAARIGLVLSILILLAFIFRLNLLAFSISGLLGLFSFLESALGLCVACEIYPFVYNFLYRDKV
jgi:hypothetical protein